MTPEPRVSQRLLRGYAPLVGFAAVFLAIALIVPSQTQEVSTAASSGDIATAPVPGDELTVDDGTTPEDTALDPGVTETTAADGATTGATGAGGAQVAGTSKQRAAAGKTAAPGAAAAGGGSNTIAFCTDRKKQDPNDVYSPPCYAPYTGDNGGATSPGVTKDAVTVSVRIQAFDNGLVDAISKLAGAKIKPESRDTIANTVRGLVEYFNRTYNFWGRKLNLVLWEGKGSVEKELLGGGAEGAEADALQVQSQVKAFADASAITPPYIDALVRRKVVALGAPYMSQEWLTQRRPYAWSPLTDCSTVVKTVGSYYLTRMAGKPANYAGGALKGQPRRTMVIAPDNSWYQECVNAGLKIIRDGGAGGELLSSEAYRLDLTQMAQQATSLMQKIKASGATTIVCGCDPIMISMLTSKAKEQQVQPEWVETGLVLTDQDIVAQIFDQGVWNKAFGISFAGPTQPTQAGMGYKAFKAVRPKETPSVAADLIYSNLLVLAIGVQMAGPSLTPASFEAGMFKYPAAVGTFGTWDFGPGDYTASSDAREIWWNSNAKSIQNGELGTWVDASPGARYPLGKFPPGDPKVG